MAPQTAAAAPHQAQPATAQPIQRRTSQWLLDREKNRAADALEQQAWRAHISGLPAGTQPRLCQDCAHFAGRDAACRKIITAIDPVFGPSLAKCSAARKSDGACGFAATLFTHVGSDLPATGSTVAIEAVAVRLLDADLWPVDSELVLEIRAMFLSHWGLDNEQADARMSRLNYGEAVAALPRPAPGAIGTTFGGGIYAGISRGTDGAPDEHLALLDGDVEGMNWDAANAWAASQGGRLPTRSEQRLLMANLPDQFQAAWYWSNEPAGSSAAWSQHFDDGLQYDSYRSYEGRARVVRRLPI